MYAGVILAGAVDVLDVCRQNLDTASRPDNSLDAIPAEGNDCLLLGCNRNYLHKCMQVI